jgi:hypothetical protein
MHELVNNGGEEDNPMQEEILEEERQMEIMTKVLGGRCSGHVKGVTPPFWEIREMRTKR